ncbi:MAG: primosomal protein N' [Verrucomicrobia bacterium]|nr:primosomal protein N' [Verrucomicrobiota bacterium]
MSNQKTLFVDVILPLALPNVYTYRLPRDWNDEVKIGQRVIVQFGKGRKQYSALVDKIHEQPPQHYQAKYIEAIVDQDPILTLKNLKFWKWVAKYYMCNLGDVMSTALPAGLRLASETKVLLHPNYREVDPTQLDDKGYLILEALELRNELTLKEMSEILQIKSVQSIVKQLIEQKLVMVEEEIKSRYTPKMIDLVSLEAELLDEKKLQTVFDALEKAPKQLEILMNFVQMSQLFSSYPKEVKKLELQRVSGASGAQIQALVKKRIFQITQREAGRIELTAASSSLKELSEDQKGALREINLHFESHSTVLLKGVTSSGKTEVYIQLIQDIVSKGQQVLYLLPEIALTTQIVQRLQVVFGEKIGVYHSKFNENERVEVWNKVLSFKQRNDEFQIILGARSALFLPFQNLGLVIVDEEHESSFKQHDPAPRYHARDAAIVLANMQDAKVLLGSATPSLESMYNVQKGKFAMVKLEKRYRNMELPEILIADIREASRKKKMKSHFSPQLVRLMEETLHEGKQIILFQNRRGFAPFLFCETCGNSPQCVNCDVSLTYHKYQRKLSCHYCGYHIRVPVECPSCGDTNLHFKGFGTEKIEEELVLFFPEAKTARMDLDTTRAKKAYHQIINSFQEREVDILVGTQMVTKGLDFDHVGLVGVLNADNLLHFPDFRAFERSYQLMSQVAGRAGRKGKRGKVMIQTYNPEHRIIKQIVDQQFEGMVNYELIERKALHYPPYYRLIHLSVRHRDQHDAERAARMLSVELKKLLGKRLLGPETPSIARIRNYYHQNMMIKLEHGISLDLVKSQLAKVLAEFRADKKHQSVRIVVNVDPQ